MAKCLQKYCALISDQLFGLPGACPVLRYLVESEKGHTELTTVVIVESNCLLNGLAF